MGNWNGRRTPTRAFDDEINSRTAICGGSTEVALALAKNGAQATKLRELARLKSSKGRCENCGGEIIPKRIEALRHDPLFCLHCQERVEKRLCVQCGTELKTLSWVNYYSFLCEECEIARRRFYKPP